MTPRIVVDALDVDDEPEDRPEEIGPDRGAERAPLGEDDEPDRDPAAAADGLVAVPARARRERDRRPGEAGQQPADEDVGVARAVDVDALGVGGRRALADGAEVEARPGPVDPVPGRRDEQVADVRQHALVAEEARADDRDAGQDRDRQPRQRRDLAGARQAVAEDPRQARPEERQGEPRDDLVGAKVDGHDPVEEAEQRRRRASPRRAPATGCRSRRGREARDRADEHHPLDAEVQHAGPLGEDLADRREEQDRAAGDAGGQDQ